MVLNHDFRAFLKSLIDNEVRYLVVGGYAVAFHGYPRYTKDIDIWIDQSLDNANGLTEALEQFGFASLGLSPKDFTESDQIIQLGHPPNRIDLITSLTGVSFSACYDTRAVHEIDGLMINFIDLENLKANKKATGCHQDLADLEHLEP